MGNSEGLWCMKLMFLASSRDSLFYNELIFLIFMVRNHKLLGKVQNFPTSSVFSEMKRYQRVSKALEIVATFDSG